ncbi:MAG TPA: enhanced serine sensitivity protein SseB C-terminal domain-containing protein [Rhodanobacteraceae bacterium]|nr:enhanced serine sensitivity protein SseB C-terminal domain-containing protein [Rhodanobacteraceae bacterium]
MDQLIARALKDSREEAPLFRALLAATLYAHVPISDDSKRLRMIQFIHPDTGQTLLPVFTDEAKARKAAGASARLIAMPGRDLLRHTRGATLMLNPNDTNCILYPEEVKALLAGRSLPTFEKYELKDAEQCSVSIPDQVPEGLLRTLKALYATFECVGAAYIIEIRKPDPRDLPILLIAVEVEPAETERVIRASIEALGPYVEGPHAVDLLALNPADGPNETFANVEPFYTSIKAAAGFSD